MIFGLVRPAIDTLVSLRQAQCRPINENPLSLRPMQALLECVENSEVASKERTTQQKRAVVEAFENAGRPLTVHEVHEAAAKTCRSIGVATIYRTINRLVETEWLKEVCLPGQPTRYEQKSLAHHHHFHCDACQVVLDVSAPCEGLYADVPEGFRVERHELTFYGVCNECVESA